MAPDDVAFDPAASVRLSPQVALRDEAFGALAYHYGTRRLVFLKSRALVEVVRSLERYGSAVAAVEAVVARDERPGYLRAVARLAEQGIVVAA